MVGRICSKEKAYETFRWLLTRGISWIILSEIKSIARFLTISGIILVTGLEKLLAIFLENNK